MDLSNPSYGPPADLYRKPHPQQNHSNERVSSRSQRETFNQGKMGPPAPIPIDPSLGQWSQNYHSTYFSHEGSSNQDSRIEHRHQGRSLLPDNPQGLDAIPIGVLEPRTGELESNPLLRFWQDDGPWYPRGLGEGGLGQTPALSHAISHERSKRSHPSHGHHGHYGHPVAGTALGGRFLGRQSSDSGYGTQSHVTGSVFSRDYDDQIPDNQSLASETDRPHARLENAPPGYIHEASEEAQPLPFDNCSDDSREPGTLTSLTCDYPDCRTTLKTQSEYRKHRQRHEKLFVCQERDCTRQQKGFSTKNDLDRHKKSVHKITPTNIADKSFRCRGLNCTKRDKIWPRLDNFRSHGKRVHKDEDLEELVRKSEIDNNVTPIHDEVRDRAGSHPAGPPSARKGSNQNHGASHEGASPGEHSLHEGMREPVIPGTGTAKTPQLPVIAPFDGTNPAIDSRLDVDDARHPKEPRHLTRGGYSAHSPLTGTSIQPVFEANELTLSRNVPQQYVSLFQSKADDAAANISQSTPSSRVHVPSAEKRVSGIQAEQLSKAISADINQYMKQPLSEEVQTMIRNRVLGLLNPLGSSKRTVEHAGLDGAPDPPGKRVACSICLKTMGRPCDIKKHEKRHRRPYGCTHATCTKAFGSKNDWKRHENSQHYQLETWRCHEPNARSKINQCARIFYRRDPFLAHLRKDHDIADDEYIRDQCKRGRIGRNGQSGFWCGFCKTIVKLEKRGLEAWDERFNHIDDEHFKQGRRIEDWYPPDKDIPKGSLRTENILDSGGPSTALDASEDEDSDGEPACNGSNATRTTVPQKPQIVPLAPTTTLSAPRQHETPDEVENSHAIETSRSNKRQKTSPGLEWFCCKCRMGPHNAQLVVSCWGESCNEHRICTHCRVIRY